MPHTVCGSGWGSGEGNNLAPDKNILIFARLPPPFPPQQQQEQQLLSLCEATTTLRWCSSVNDDRKGGPYAHHSDVELC